MIYLELFIIMEELIQAIILVLLSITINGLCVMIGVSMK